MISNKFLNIVLLSLLLFSLPISAEAAVCTPCPGQSEAPACNQSNGLQLLCQNPGLGDTDGQGCDIRSFADYDKNQSINWDQLESEAAQQDGKHEWLLGSLRARLEHYSDPTKVNGGSCAYIFFAYTQNQANQNTAQTIKLQTPVVIPNTSSPLYLFGYGYKDADKDASWDQETETSAPFGVTVDGTGLKSGECVFQLSGGINGGTIAGLTIKVKEGVKAICDLSGKELQAVAPQFPDIQVVSEQTAPTGPQDTDGDGVLDSKDNCPTVPNATNTPQIKESDDWFTKILKAAACALFGCTVQADVDGDGQGDACDTDDDGDGILDWQPGSIDQAGNTLDNCPQDANTNQKDLDDDDVGDVCDVDIDGDGVDNTEDDCPSEGGKAAGCPEAKYCVNAQGQALLKSGKDEDGDGIDKACDSNDNPPDGDQDGIPDSKDLCDDKGPTEACISGFQSSKWLQPPDCSQEKDYDGDGLGNFCDADIDNDGISNKGDPNPNSPDADGDGLCDRGGQNTVTIGGIKISCSGKDECPTQAAKTADGCPASIIQDNDKDGDGVNDVSDNCPTVKNGPKEKPNNQTDTDKDDQGDACDADDDGDKIDDPQDNCSKIANPTQENSGGSNLGDACEDQDGDGIMDDLDACDTEKGFSSPDPLKNGCMTTIDGDGDGVNDTTSNGTPLDNCPTVKNGPTDPDNQTDTDQDGAGDACDTDDDSDGVDDKNLNGTPKDNCPLVANPGQEDTGGINGVGDVCEDQDGDGIMDNLDACDTKKGSFGTDPLKNGCPQLACELNWFPVAGGGILLFWSTNDAATVSLTQDINGVVTPLYTDPSLTVSLPANDPTTYTLKALDVFGNDCTKLILVPAKPKVAPVSCDEFIPSLDGDGKTYHLSWKTQNADIVLVNGQPVPDGQKESGSIDVVPAGQTQYKMVAIGINGISCQIDTVVTPQAPVVLPPTCKLTDTAIPDQPDSFTLSWETSNNKDPIDVTLYEGDPPQKATKLSDPSGSVVVTPLTLTKYTIFVQGPGGACTNSDVPLLLSMFDNDGDGVMDGKDLCPNTAPGPNVNGDGCPVAVLDLATQCVDPLTGEIKQKVGKDEDQDEIDVACDAKDTPPVIGGIKDADNDGLSDDAEGKLGTDPTKSDTDGDGVGDPFDCAPTDPLRSSGSNCFTETKTVVIVGNVDFDHDGICNSLELVAAEGTCTTGPGGKMDNCDLVSNPGQEDADADGVGDACEAGVPTIKDADGDGVPDDLERLFGTDPDKADTDGDGCNDYQETATNKLFPIQSPIDPDSDNDGVCDCSGTVEGVCAPVTPGQGDNCPIVSNGPQTANIAPESIQLDSDGDGMGNACQDDTDGDGVTNDQDNCTIIANPAQTDADKDGLGDLCDAIPGANVTPPEPSGSPPTPDESEDVTGAAASGGCACQLDGNGGRPADAIPFLLMMVPATIFWGVRKKRSALTGQF